MRAPRLAGLAAVTLFAVASAGRGAEAKASTSCLACHGNADFFDEAGLRIVADFAEDVHSAAGLSCHDCHGGNPDPALAEDPAAMDPDFASNPYRGVPARTDIPASCGRCHSDPALMKRFRPDLRVDQEREYRTSVHGQALARGDTKVATCVDCHGVHKIARIVDPRSPVHPKRVAETCRGCHADAARMSGYKLPDGRPLPLDQYALWRRSVHAQSLLERDDLSAPTCNDCHGNHGATPPGVDSIAFICGQCHGREAELFRASAKQTGFAEHNELLASAEDAGCAACHDSAEPAAALTSVHGFTECATCHGNHAVVRPTIAMLAGLPETPCALCHEGPATPVAEPEAARRNYERTRNSLLAAAKAQGLTGSERFDWLVDQALVLPTHTLAEGGPELRPEIGRLFSKFRIGKTSFTYEDPRTGKPVRSAVVRCADCHAAEPVLAGEPVGLRTGEQLLGGMRELTARTARAERILLAARRGGVETRQALAEIDGAVDAQIELEVLVHSFAADPESAFAKKRAEGLAHADKALAAAQRAQAELAFRRKGLALSLVFVVALLIGLFLKIRELSRREPQEV
jgi:hypothetical protein